MTYGSKHRRNNKPSIRCWWIPLDLQSFEPNIDIANSNGCQHSSSHTKSGKSADTISSNSRLSTSQFVSAVVGLWDFVGQPPEQRREECLNYGEINQKENSVCYSNSQNIGPTVSVDSKKFSNDFTSESCFPYSAKSGFENLKEVKRWFLLPSCNRNVGSYSKWIDFLPSLDTCRYDKVTSIGVPNLACENGSIATKLCFDPKDPSNSTRSECDGADESNIAENKCPPTDQPSAHNIKSNDTNQVKDSFRGKNVNITENVMQPPKLQYATYLFQPVTAAGETIVESTSLNSDLHVNYSVGVLTALGQSQQSIDSKFVPVESLSKVPTSKKYIFHGNCNRLIYGNLEEDYIPKRWLSVKDKLQNVFVKNKHAVAGALAGTMVSLCLHPVDTIKTIIQANAAGEWRLNTEEIFKCILQLCCQKLSSTENVTFIRSLFSGVSRLYRGISSNIAASAPISAIYTFTYESVKGALLPVLPKEYYSLAHCIAGGCSSIATSFIFTPSERIKQQMQVGLRYQNSWSALIGCLEKGGISSLYAGWGAVLCRNIPHSMIKFYTYESLKRYLLTSAKPDARPSTLQTLVCGGIAGSTAALFTTPFDVVKTRLQTQVPGSLARYDGVLHALQAIAKQEGLQGLYRGLTPRLAMYVSQGAIFFASYEFLKAVFSLDAQQSSRVADNEENVDDTAAPRCKN